MGCEGPIDRAGMRSAGAMTVSAGLWVDPPGQVWEDYVHQMTNW